MSIATDDSTRGPQQIVDDANELAREFYGSMGYEVQKGYRFDKAHHPQEVGMWRMACMAYEHIQGTDVEMALAEIEE